MADADKTYNIDMFMQNLLYMEQQGASSATIPQLSGTDHPAPAGGHPLIDIQGLAGRILSAPPSITVPLTGDASITFKKTQDGGFITIQGTF